MEFYAVISFLLFILEGIIYTTPKKLQWCKKIQENIIPSTRLCRRKFVRNNCAPLYSRRHSILKSSLAQNTFAILCFFRLRQPNINVVKFASITNSTFLVFLSRSDDCRRPQWKGGIMTRRNRKGDEDAESLSTLSSSSFSILKEKTIFLALENAISSIATTSNSIRAVSSRLLCPP